MLGGYHYLGREDRINGPLFCTSKIISCIVASAAEAELGAGFQNAQKAIQFRTTLAELGYPQGPTTLLLDNTVAIGLACDTVNAKRSKSMDMRFFWLRDRVRQGHFRIKHLPGIWNIADFFTKPLPKIKFEQFVVYLVVNLERMNEPNQPPTQTVTMAKM